MAREAFGPHRVLGNLRFAGGLLLVVPHALPSLSVLLSVNAGYLDTAGFLALHGLFTAHVTGNMVTLGASLVLGHSGAVAKLMALPVFCCVVGLVRLAALWLAEHEWRQLRVLLWVEFVLLSGVFVSAVAFGPFPNADAPTAIMTGMTAVAAMAVQNAAQRLHLTDAPPSTLMTGNVTQLMIDAVDLLRKPSRMAAAALRARMLRMASIVASFTLGCGLAVLFFIVIHTWCFALPLVLGLLAVVISTDAMKPGRRTTSNS